LSLLLHTCINFFCHIFSLIYLAVFRTRFHCNLCDCIANEDCQIEIPKNAQLTSFAVAASKLTFVRIMGFCPKIVRCKANWCLFEFSFFVRKQFVSEKLEGGATFFCRHPNYRPSKCRHLNCT
jgi:hypothetical protein